MVISSPLYSILGIIQHDFDIFLNYISPGIEKIRVHDLRHSHASLLIELGWNILMVSQRLGHEKVETIWQTYAHLYPDKEKMLANQLNMVKTQGITSNLTIEEQLVKFMGQMQQQFQTQPALSCDIDKEQIIRWDPVEKQKAIVTREEFEIDAELNRNLEADLAVLEIIQAGYLEICGLVYCLSVTVHTPPRSSCEK